MKLQKDFSLGAIESRFADIIWNHEPLGSGRLVELAETELNWKKSTTYTVLKKLCQRGIFKNENGIVTSVYDREEFHSLQGKQFLEENFEGSLPAFIAAFAKRQPLSEEEIEEIKVMIDNYKGGVADV